MKSKINQIRGLTIVNLNAVIGSCALQFLLMFMQIEAVIAYLPV